MGAAPFWDYDPVVKEWGWAKPPPPSQRPGGAGDSAKKTRKKARTLGPAPAPSLLDPITSCLSLPLPFSCPQHTF